MAHSNEQKALLRELSMNPVWGSMLRDIEAMGGVPRYQRRGDKSAEEKQADWIYKSGMDAAIEKVLRYLGYD